MPGLESPYENPKLKILPKNEGKEKTSEGAEVSSICEKLGINFSDIAGSEIPERWRELGEKTKVLEDELRAVEHLESAESFLGRYYPDRAMTAEEVSVIKAASLLTDISKTGWSGAAPAEREVITKIYAEDRRFDPTRTLGEFTDSFFEADEAKKIKTSLSRMSARGVRPDMTFREFINLHAGWSYEIARKSKLPEKVVQTAALHHFLEGVMPVDFDLERSNPNTLITREVIWVTILDKYDAQRRRAKVSHTEAIEWLYQFVNEDYGGGLAKIPNEEQRNILRKRFLDAIFELDQSLAEEEQLRKVA